MPRSKSSVPRKSRIKKILKQAKGYYGKRKNIFSIAKQSIIRSGMFAFAHRRKKKRDFSRLWQTRINAAARDHGLTYARLKNGLSKAQVRLNKKSLSSLVVDDPDAFKTIVEVAKKTLG